MEEGGDYEFVYSETSRERVDVVLAAWAASIPGVKSLRCKLFAVPTLTARPSSELSSSRAWIKSGISKGLVTVNGAAVKKGGQKVKKGDAVRLSRAIGTNVGAVTRAQTTPFELCANPEVKLDVLYEDDWLAIINKPKAMVMHPSPESGRNFHDSLVNGLLARYGLEGLSSCEDGTRPGIVHRLDVDTSGVVVIAKTDEAYKKLHAQFRDRKASMERTYVAIVAGGFGKAGALAGTVDAPIGRHPKHGTKRCVFDRKQVDQKKHIKEAITHWKVTKEYCGHKVALVSCNLETGRTHQIRVHMKHIQHGLLCDPLYGPGNMACAVYEPALQRILEKHGVIGQFLHAQTLAFDHPCPGKGKMRFEAPLPPYFDEALQYLGEIDE
jgi:23S rRNA pseudouridine1911/1915/1917 synthase